MFDVYSMETLVPSLLMIAVMSVAMVWGGFKIKDLMENDPKK